MVERSKLWDSLYREHAPALLRYLEQRFGRNAPPEDLLHDTFVQAIRGSDRLERAESPRAWLFGIARHVGLTAVRGRKPVESITDAFAAQAEDATDPRWEAVSSAMERLSPLLREPLELRLRHELSYEEIASVLGIPLGTVRSRLHHAVRQLRNELSDKATAGRSTPESHS